MTVAGSVILGRVPPTTVLTRGQECAAEILRTPDDRELPAGAVHALCSMACSDDAEAARAGTDALFRQIVEHWGDRFEPKLCDRYIEFFSAVIEYVRRMPGAGEFDAGLRALGCEDAAALIGRAKRQRLWRPEEISNRAAVRKAFVLSRVTLGADVAVTSVFLEAAKRVFPAAEILFVAGEKAGALFARDGRIRRVAVEYSRGGPLLGRLECWLRAAHAVALETAGLRPGEFVILDPDSRITQLGLLPLDSHENASYFFESRAYGADSTASLGQLSAQWLQEALGPEAAGLLPYVCLASEDLALGRAARQAFGGRIATVNFGVGGNDGKRLGEAFELELLRLLAGRRYSVVLDSGAGADELDRTRRLAELCRADGITVGGIRPGRCDQAGLVTWQGSLSGLAGIASASDLYIGYDSAGGHLAAALGVPGIDIFVGAVCERMRQRWSPWGRMPGAVVAAGKSWTVEQALAAVEKLIP